MSLSAETLPNPPRIWETDEPMPLEQALETLMEHDLQMFGHGTNQYVNDIMNEGFDLRFPDISTTTMPIGGSFLPDGSPDEYHADHPNLKLIREWPHWSDYIVVLGVGTVQENSRPNYAHAIVQEKPPEERVEDKGFGGVRNYRIDPRFVAGYFDVNQEQFIPNPTFDPTFNPELLDTTPELSLRSNENPKAVLDRLYGGDKEPLSLKERIAAIAVSSALDCPDVW